MNENINEELLDLSEEARMVERMKGMSRSQLKEMVLNLIFATDAMQQEISTLQGTIKMLQSSAPPLGRSFGGVTLPR